MIRPLVLLLMLPLGGCASVALGGAIGFDAGTLAADGVETGMGVQVEAIGSPWEGSGFRFGPSLQLAGYSSRGDVDPITFTTIEVRYHSAHANPSRAFLEFGTGAGVAWSPNLHHLAIPLQVEVGFQRDLGLVNGRIGLRERFIALVGSGDPSLDAFNSVQLTLGITTGDGF